jgi:hypothetical protein
MYQQNSNYYINSTGYYISSNSVFCLWRHTGTESPCSKITAWVSKFLESWTLKYCIARSELALSAYAVSALILRLQSMMRQLPNCTINQGSQQQFSFPICKSCVGSEEVVRSKTRHCVSTQIVIGFEKWSCGRIFICFISLRVFNFSATLAWGIEHWIRRTEYPV